MDRFKDKDKNVEKFWLVVVISVFINLNFSSIDNIFFQKLFSYTQQIYVFINDPIYNVFCLLFVS